MHVLLFMTLFFIVINQFGDDVTSSALGSLKDLKGAGGVNGPKVTIGIVRG
jgi:hypothetical protein